MRLAICGGEPVRKKPFPGYRVIGAEEKEAALRVLDSGILSGFMGSWERGFGGGPEILALEAEWAAYFGARHAIAVNSNTSGLFSVMGAIGLAPGDEVVVSPYTMSASAVAPLIYCGIPVFADIESDYYCIAADDLRRAITPRTQDARALRGSHSSERASL